MTLVIATKRDPYHWGTMLAALLLSLWIFVSPWVLPDPADNFSALNFHAAGALAAVLSALGIVRRDDYPEYGLLAVAVWMAVSPWVLHLSELSTRQIVFYAILLGGMAWVGRPSFKPKGVD